MKILALSLTILILSSCTVPEPDPAVGYSYQELVHGKLGQSEVYLNALYTEDGSITFILITLNSGIVKVQILPLSKVVEREKQR